MKPGNLHIQEEMREVEEELEEDASRNDAQNPRGSFVPLEAAEEGKAGSPEASNGVPASPSKRRYSISSLMSRSTSPKPARGPSIAFPLSGGGGVGPMKGGGGKHWTIGLRDRVRNGLQLVTNPVFAQAFLLTFLGEWGDRSQITTIAMGGAHVSIAALLHGGVADGFDQSIPVIAFGTIVGHGLCTFGAVMGGRYLSTKISVQKSESAAITS